VAYRMMYDGESDVLTIVFREGGMLSHAEGLEDIVLHLDSTGRPLFLEILRASEVVPPMFQALPSVLHLTDMGMDTLENVWCAKG